MENDILEIAKKVLKTEADAIMGLLDRLNDEFMRAVDVIYNSNGRVVVTGMGKSGIIAKKIAATMASTGTPAFFMHPAEASHGDLGMVTREDIILAISNSGETDEIINLIPFIKRFNLTIIAMTGNLESTLSKEADITLDVSVKEEACPMGIVPTASTTAALAMGDALAVALFIKRGFKKEDFAFFHPSGSLGKRLFIKVKDLMHTGDSLPLVKPDTPMLRAIIEISSKRLGVAAVVDDDMKVVGIITDGDLRRSIERWGKKLFDMHAGDIMTRNPKIIGKYELAVNALSIMEERSITSLLVPDEDGRIKGIIHIHDILKKGIA